MSIKSFIVGCLLASASALPSYKSLQARNVPSALQPVLPPSQDPFYTAPDGFEDAAPGQILRMRAARGNLTAVTKNSSEAYQILYRTTDSRYNASWAVTTLFTPLTSSPNTTADKLVSFQVAYDSAFVDASPSYALYSMPEAAVSIALGRGWFVNVPDYEGPLASFTAGIQSGHATIDSVRAALSASEGLGLSSDARYAMWGNSGGALASEWAAELQEQYAPELDFAGAVLTALTPNVTSVLLSIEGSVEAGLGPSGILGLSSQYPEVQSVIEKRLKTSGPFNATGFNAARNYTLSQSIAAFAGQKLADYFTDGLGILDEPIVADITNRDGVMGYHGVPRMPVLAFKSIGDMLSPINDTDALVQRYCGVGATVDYQRNSVGGHSATAANAQPAVLSFLDAVLGGMYTQTGCQTRQTAVNISSITF